MGLFKDLKKIGSGVLGVSTLGVIGTNPRDVIGGITGANAAARAAQRASETQAAAADRSIAALAPFQQAGVSALTAQQDLLGLNGPEKQAAAYAALEASPEFAGLFRQGENAILANASATGGLRGGNIQAALAQFRPSVLNQVIGQRFDRLGGLTSLGQNAAAGVGNLYGQQGAALAGGQLAAGQRSGQIFGQALQLGGLALGALGGGPLGAGLGGAAGSQFAGGFGGAPSGFNLGTGSGSVAGNLGGGFAPLPTF